MKAQAQTPRQLIKTLIYLVSNLITATLQTSEQASTANPQKSAFQFFKNADKDMVFKISFAYPDQKYLLTSYFIDYRPRSENKIKNQEKGKGQFDGYLRFLVIGERGIYLRKMKQTWMEATFNRSQVEFLKPVKELESYQDRLTAALMIPNERLFTVASKKLTLTTYKIDFTKEKNMLTTISFLDASYKLSSDPNEEIRSIGQIPYTDSLLISANRFELIKFNRRTRRTERTKAPLDATRHIKCPTVTSNPLQDPYGPFQRRERWHSNYYNSLGTQTSCVMTSYKSPVNVVIDWTTLKPVKYWNGWLMDVHFEEYQNVVESIAFFGGIPKASTFVFTTAGESEYIYLFDTLTNERVMKYRDQQKVASKVVNWINGTMYVSVYSPRSAMPFYRTQMMFIKLYTSFYLKLTSNEVHQFNLKEVDNYNILGVLTELEEIVEYRKMPDPFQSLDAIFLGYYVKSNELSVQASMLNWDHCRGELMSYWDNPSQEQNNQRMVYGRFKVCSKCEHIEKLPSPNIEEDIRIMETNTTVMNCFKRKPPGQEDWKDCHELEFDGYKKIEHIETLRVQNLWGSDCKGTYLIENQKEFINNDGCHPGYALDRFGICRNCPSLVKIKQKWGSSDCFFFNVELKEDHYLAHIYNYTAQGNSKNAKNPEEKYVKIKGVNQDNKNEQRITYDLLFFSNQDIDVNQNLKFIETEFSISRDIDEGNTQIWKGQGLPGKTDCYLLQDDPKNSSSYIVYAKRGYTLEPMQKYVSVADFSLQQEKYPTGPLNSLVCVKSCPMGQYYDFESLSCRQCSLGCSTCTKPDECELCSPGLSKVKESEHHKEDMIAKIGICLKGCQNGFFKKRYDGACNECNKHCLVCRDRSILEKKLLTANRSEEVVGGSETEGFCLICIPVGPSGEVMFADAVSGLCVSECEDPGMILMNRKTSSLRSIREYTVCERCHDPNCDVCKSDLKGDCETCRAGFSKLEDNSCLQDSDATFYYVLLTGILSIIFVGCLLGTSMVYYFVFYTSKKDLKKRAVLKRRSRFSSLGRKGNRSFNVKTQF